MALKDALVRSEPGQAKAFAQTALNDLKDLAKTSEMHAQSFLEGIEESLVAIANSSDLKAQRTRFVTLSEQMIPVAVELEDKDRTLYVQYCPMANQDRGAQWLSWQEEIRNPYYGDAMLTCGEVRRKL